MRSWSSTVPAESATTLVVRVGRAVLGDQDGQAGAPMRVDQDLLADRTRRPPSRCRCGAHGPRTTRAGARVGVRLGVRLRGRGRGPRCGTACSSSRPASRPTRGPASRSPSPDQLGVGQLGSDREQPVVVRGRRPAGRATPGCASRRGRRWRPARGVVGVLGPERRQVEHDADVGGAGLVEPRGRQAVRRAAGGGRPGGRRRPRAGPGRARRRRSPRYAAHHGSLWVAQTPTRSPSRSWTIAA